MEILQFLVSLLSNNSFNLENLFKGFNSKGLNFESLGELLNNPNLKPIIDGFTSLFNNKSPTMQSCRAYGLEPICDIADKDIIFTLNKYFCS